MRYNIRVLYNKMSWIADKIKKLWTGYSQDSERLYEAKLIHKWGGLSQKDVKISDINISSNPDDLIHSISISSGDKIPLILIPGYGASGAYYYKIMKKLSTVYDLHVVDMRGMGWYF